MLTAIAPQSCLYAAQPEVTKKRNGSSQHVYEELASPTICPFMSDEQANAMESGDITEEQQLFFNVVISNHEVGFTPYGTFPAQEGAQNNPIPIEDVQKFRSWLKKAKITLPLSCIRTLLNAGIKLLTQIIKKLESKGEISANQESNSNCVSAEDAGESVAEIPASVAEAVNELHGFDKYRHYQLGAAALNNAYNLYCVTQNIKTPGPALVSFLISVYALAGPLAGTLLLPSENKVSKESGSTLGKANKGKTTTDEDLNALQGKERSQNHHLSKDCCLSATSVEWSSVRGRKSSTSSNLSDITVINVEQNLLDSHYFDLA